MMRMSQRTKKGSTYQFFIFHPISTSAHAYTTQQSPSQQTKEKKEL